MSIEQRSQITDIAKWVLWLSISVSSFLIANTYQKVDSKMDKLSEKAEAIEARLIRVEYELKLK